LIVPLRLAIVKMIGCEHFWRFNNDVIQKSSGLKIAIQKIEVQFLTAKRLAPILCVLILNPDEIYDLINLSGQLKWRLAQTGTS
jgi:hypothetical protein